MARIRTIKPEFCVSEQLSECSTNARLVFALMWMFCDDQGVHPAKVKTLKGEIFPLDDAITVANVADWVRELIDQGLLREYAAGSETYWYVTGWKRHQKIDKPSRKHPPPPAEDSTNPTRTLSEASPPEGKGRESKGEEGKTQPPVQAQQSIAARAPEPAPDARFAALTALAEAGRVRVDAKARMHLRQWAAEGITDQQLQDAIDLAREKKPHPNERIPIGFLVALMADVLAGTRQPTRTAEDVSREVIRRGLERDAERLGNRWWEDHRKVVEKGTEEGVRVIPNQPFEEYQARVLTAAGNGPWMDQLPDPLRERVEHYRAHGVNP